MPGLSRLVLVSLLVLVPGSALAYLAWNRHFVYPIGDGIWEVVSRPGSSAADYWCASGDFVTNTMSIPATQRLYLWKGLGPSVTTPGHTAVQFSLTPPKGVDLAPPLTLSVHRVGDNMTRALARQYCFGSGADELERRFLN